MKKKRKIYAKIPFDIEYLENVILFIYSNSHKINRKNLQNIYRLMNLVDKSMYENDEEILYRLDFITRSCYGFCKKGLRDNSILYDYASDCEWKDLLEENILPLITSGNVILEDEAEYILEQVNEKLRYAFLYTHKDKLYNLLDDLENNNFGSLSDINERFDTLITGLKSKIRKAKMKEADVENTFSLSDKNSFIDAFTRTYNKLTSPSNKLKTGIKLLNKALSSKDGGFESRRFYLFLGVSGGFKSGFLITVALHIIKYNKGFKTKSPEKRPVVLYLTQENSVTETLQRIYLMKTGRELENEKCVERVFKELKAIGFYPSDDPNDIGLEIIYKANRSISTDDIYDIIEELEDEGKEVICVIHDYIKRIRSAEHNTDVRIELGDISNEFCSLAIEKDIPVISAAQFNRNAIKTIDAAIESGRMDKGKLLNVSDIGESLLMVDNSDFVGILYQEYKKEGKEDKKYLTFKVGKKRGGEIEVPYFAHPFEDDNWLKLIEDIDEPQSLSLLQLSDSQYMDSEEEIENIVRGKRMTKSLQTKVRATQSFNQIKTNDRPKFVIDDTYEDEDYDDEDDL